MNLKNLAGEVHSSVYHQVQKRGYAASVDVLMDLGVLSKQDYENWRFGRIDYLERVCKVNLKKLAEINHQMRVYAQKTGLKPSVTVYKKYGSPSRYPNGKIRPLRFSKYGDPKVEQWYATHFVDPNFKQKAKAEKAAKEAEKEIEKDALEKNAPLNADVSAKAPAKPDQAKKAPAPKKTSGPKKAKEAPEAKKAPKAKKA